MTASDPSPAASATGPAAELTPAQRALLRLVCWVAMADGDFAEQERQLLQKLVASTLPAPADSAADAVQALAAGALEEPDLEALVADLDDADDRQLAVKLAFQMACVNQRPEDDAVINTAEKRAYRRLVELLKLPETEVAEAEWAARQELQQRPSLLELISGPLAGFGAWPPLEGDGGAPPAYWL
ncbi:TerB family tellurite resistance protein [Cyanobium sp. CH-040]|uniref:TerB family tellurite resistance protein n=1 Tax=Cyanobium sp. CH-040 TaxID=2823708 RepID=UPI0020CE5EF8|nr:TerB family tellurite resistance protein [Cyanobium sp. CH-040]MCP9926680.1 TerB family tellurite resistance protein [Cyanobium sp. CH-040]